MEFSLKEIISTLFLKVDVVGYHSDLYFRDFKSLNGASKNSLSFCVNSDDNAVISVSSSKAKIIIIDDKLYSVSKNTLLNLKKTYLISKNPKLDFVKVLSFCFGSSHTDEPETKIHESSYVHNKATIGHGCQIGKHCHVGESKLGENCRIEDGVQILDKVAIGNNVQIGRYCIIGSEGFGYVRDENGVLLGFPQIGGVTIGDNVEIYPFCDIDRGTLDDTIIENGVKINHHGHVAHNCHIGKNCLIRSGVHICGSTKIMNNVTIGSSCVIRDHITIGSYAVVGMGAVVVSNIPERKTVVGNPARILQIKSPEKK